MADKDDILKLLRDQEAAVARGDAAGVVAPMDDDYVLFDLPPPLVHRGDAAQGEAALNDWFASWKDGVTVALRDPQVTVSGNLAAVYGLSRMRGTKKDGGSVDNWSRRTVVLAKRDGAWRMIHEHNSFPTKMDGSGASAMDLKPE
ncbi:MAG: nuclear transport factor 2 family protein [Pseudolabrys sp.]|nr:nuclear transport factor 2 family protein [Pseudolabrys sp.]